MLGIISNINSTNDLISKKTLLSDKINNAEISMFVRYLNIQLRERKKSIAELLERSKFLENTNNILQYKPQDKNELGFTDYYRVHHIVVQYANINYCPKYHVNIKKCSFAERKEHTWKIICNGSGRVIFNDDFQEPLGVIGKEIGV
jgi:hypothetical protein